MFKKVWVHSHSPFKYMSIFLCPAAVTYCLYTPDSTHFNQTFKIKAHHTCKKYPSFLKSKIIWSQWARVRGPNQRCLQLKLLQKFLFLFFKFWLMFMNHNAERAGFRPQYLYRYPHGDSSQVGRYSCKSRSDSHKCLRHMCLDALHIHWYLRKRGYMRDIM